MQVGRTFKEVYLLLKEKLRIALLLTFVRLKDPTAS
jgi:hypothetical protein